MEDLPVEITDLITGVTYEFKVQPDNGKKKSIMSDIVEATAAGKPSRPDAPTIEFIIDEDTGEQYYLISWDEPEDGGEDIIGYSVQTFRENGERFTA